MTSTNGMSKWTAQQRAAYDDGREAAWENANNWPKPEGDLGKFWQIGFEEALDDRASYDDECFEEE